MGLLHFGGCAENTLTPASNGRYQKCTWHAKEARQTAGNVLRDLPPTLLEQRTCHAALPRANLRGSMLLNRLSIERQGFLVSSHALKGFHL